MASVIYRQQSYSMTHFKLQCFNSDQECLKNTLKNSILKITLGSNMSFSSNIERNTYYSNFQVGNSHFQLKESKKNSSQITFQIDPKYACLSLTLTTQVFLKFRCLFDVIQCCAFRSQNISPFCRLFCGQNLLSYKKIHNIPSTYYLPTQIATCVPTRIMTAKKQVNMSQLSKNCVKSTFL